MGMAEHYIDEEPVCKKAKMVNNGDGAYLSNGAVPLLDKEERKDVSVASTNGSHSGEVLLSAIEVSKDSSVGSNEVKVKENSVLEMEERKDNVSGDADVKEDLVVESEEKKDVIPAVSGDANVKEIPTAESDEKKDSCKDTTGLKEESGLHSSAIVSSGKKLLVLDLNGLLADIVSSPLVEYIADTYVSGKAVFKRPFCDDFLKFCFEKFEIGIWSSRTQKNIDRITDFLLGDMKSKLLFCWDMSHCTKTTVGSLENRHKCIVFKELKRLWEKHEPDLPWQKGDYNETNTLLLDDSPYKALLNPPHTSIFPRSYCYQNRSDNSLGDGGDLRLYLERLAEADNVQEFTKMNPFGQEPLTETSRSWEFYSRIIRKLQL